MNALFLLIISFLIARNNFLLSLLNLEIIILILFFLVVQNLSTEIQPISPALFLLVLSACEASLGLSLLISLTRFNGNDVITNISINF